MSSNALLSELAVAGPPTCFTCVTFFTCFTRTKAQERSCASSLLQVRFTCFTCFTARSAFLLYLLYNALLSELAVAGPPTSIYACFTCFTRTKVQILSLLRDEQQRAPARARRRRSAYLLYLLYVLYSYKSAALYCRRSAPCTALLALLVQKYKILFSAELAVAGPPTPIYACFTCFTRTKSASSFASCAPERALLSQVRIQKKNKPYTCFTCFTRTKDLLSQAPAYPYACFTCFTRTKKSTKYCGVYVMRSNALLCLLRITYTPQAYGGARPP
jgi:hypothetical protein